MTERSDPPSPPLPLWQQRLRQCKGIFRARLMLALEQFAYDLTGLTMALRFGPSPPPEAKHAKFLHDFYGRHFWRQPTGWLRAIIAIILWPFALCWFTIQYTARNGAAIRERSGKSPIRQAMEQAAFALRYSLAPPWYYMFELYRPDRAPKAVEYLTAHETIAGAYDLLEPAADSDSMANKVWFAEHCRAIGIKAVPVLFYVSKARAHFVIPESDPAHDTDFFVKPRVGNGGHRAERWDRTGQGTWRNSRGLVLDRSALMDHLAAQSLLEDYVVQPRLINHPDLDDIANGALSTLRVLTCLNEHGKPEATNVSFRMAIGTNTVVDNFHQGGLAAPMDLTTGRIGGASDIGRYPHMGWREIHPVSGARFEGRLLPYWQEAIALACDAAAAFPWRTAIGWDVALLIDGPMIVEGNGKPDLDIHQRCERRPLGRARIAELLAWHVLARQAKDNSL